jgi:dienelactone hydrolase
VVGARPADQEYRRPLCGSRFLSFAPDLYHGEIARLGDEEKASALKDKYAPGAPDELAKVFDALKSHPDCTGKVGSVGFCFGGRMSLALGLLRPVDAVCTFYGGGMQNLMTAIDGLRSRYGYTATRTDPSLRGPSSSSTSCWTRSA